MTRIAFILPDLRGGGAEKSVCDLLATLCQRETGMEFDLVLVKAMGVFLGEVPASVRVVDLNRKRSLAALLPLVRYLRTNRPAVLVAHLPHINLLAAIAIRLAGTNTPVIVVEHGILPSGEDFRDMAGGRFPGKEWWVRWGRRRLYPSVAAIVAVAKSTAMNVAGQLGVSEKRVTCIYNPVVTESLLAKAGRRVFHPWLENKEIPVFLGVGRLVKEKDFVTLIAAFAELRRIRPARLIILGEGEERAELERIILQLGIGEDVDMPGFVENPYSYMASVDAFVLSSVREGLANVLIEAMACGCPVIATDCPGGPGEILQDGEFGVLVPVGNKEAMMRAMMKTLDTVIDESRLKERAAFFSPERAADAWLSLLGRVMHPPRTVLHVITGLRTGGAERMLCQLLSALDRQQWEPVVVSLTDGTEPEAWLRERGIPVYNLGMQSGKLPSISGCLRLIRLVRRIRPALIHGWMYHANLAAQVVRPFLRRRPPVVWSIHHSIGELSAEKKATAAVIRLGARLSGLPDGIVYVSRASREQHAAIGYHERKAVVIANGVDTDLFVPAAGTGGVRRELGLPESGLVIGSLARYHPMKDHRNFLRAAALLCGQPGSERVHFLLGGTGVDDGNEELRGWIREGGIGDRVHLLGERADAARVLSAMDIFTVSSSHGEALPMVLLEAMSCGVPCVTTDVGDAGMVVGDTWRVVAPRDTEALAAAWLALIDAGEEGRRVLGEAGREKIVNNYSLKICVGFYDKLYQSLTR